MKTKLTIAGAILIIIGGALWLIFSLFVGTIASELGIKLKILQYIFPICCILYGVIPLAKKDLKRSSMITYGIVLLVICLIQIIIGGFAGLGIVQLVLICLGAILFFADIPNL